VPAVAGTVLELARELPHRSPLWMGIVNLTPDAVSDGGETMTWDAVERRVDEMLEAGAQLLDLGPESTRPGAVPLTAEDEWARLEPILVRLVEKLDAFPLSPRISVDTYHADVARRALAAGARIVNDVSGLTSPEMMQLAADTDAEFVAMHSLTVPADRNVTLPADRDPVDEVPRRLDAGPRE